MARLTEQALYDRMPSDRRAYIVALRALATSEYRPSTMIDAFERVFADNTEGVIRPPLPSVVASTVEGLLAQRKTGNFDVVRDLDNRYTAQLLLAQIIDNSQIRYDTDQSVSASRVALIAQTAETSEQPVPFEERSSQ